LAAGEDIWIEGRMADQRQNLAIIWFADHDHAAPAGILPVWASANLLNLQIDRRVEDVETARFCRFPLDVRPSIDQDPPLAGSAHEMLL